MRRISILVATIAVLANSGCLFSSPAWSPQEDQLAYLCAAGGEENWLISDWLFGTPEKKRPPEQPPVFQLRIWDARSSRDVLIDQVRGVFSRPGWAPDGQSLAYVRFEPDDAAVWSHLWQQLQQVRLESPDQIWDALMGEEEVDGHLTLVRRYRDGRSESLEQKTGAFPARQLAALPWLAPAWTNDGLTLAAPWVGPIQTMVLALDKSRVEHRFDWHIFPSWASEGEQLALFRIDGQRGWTVTDRNTWPVPRFLQPASFVSDSAIWDPKGGGFWAAVQTSGLLREPGNNEPFLSVMRVSIKGQGQQEIRSFSLGRNPMAVASLTFDPRASTLFCSLYADGMTPECHAIHAESGRVQRTWHPLMEGEDDRGILFGAIEVSSSGDMLAFRYGVPDWSAPLAIYDLKRQRCTVLASNRELTAKALWVFTESAGRLVRELPPQTVSPYKSNELLQAWQRRTRIQPAYWLLDLFDRPETQAKREPIATERLNALAEYGLALTQTQKERTGPFGRSVQETELLFQYITQDYKRALESANQLARSPNISADHRQALLTIACQCALVLGHRDWVRQTLERLIAERTAQLRRYEDLDSRWELQLLGVGDDNVPTSSEGRDPLLDRLGSLWDELHQPSAAPPE